MAKQPPHPYNYIGPMPEGWKKTIDRQVLSGGVSETIVYDTPKYKGTIWWSENRYWGILAHTFTHEGKELHACDGHSIHTVLGIPEDYCVRSGADDWQKCLTQEYFHMWLMGL